MVKLATQQSSDLSIAQSIGWAAIEKVAQKQKDTDLLPEGSKNLIHLDVNGSVNGIGFSESISANLGIGYSQTRRSSVNPQVPELVAWILSKLNRATRNRILLDLPDEFVSNGNHVPKSSDVLVAEVEHMLKKLRATKTVQARGSIRCEYSV